MAAAPSRSLITILCAVLPLACGEPLSPGDVVGIYALQRVASEPLPAVLFTNDYVTVRVFADTLRLSLDSRRMRVFVGVSEPAGAGQPVEPLRWESAFGFTIIGDRIEVAFACPPNANCVAPPHLVLERTPDGLRAEFALGERVPLIYDRVSDGYSTSGKRRGYGVGEVW